MKAGVFRLTSSFRMLRLLTAVCLTAGLAALALRPTGAGADTFPVTGSWYWANQPQPAPPPLGQPLGNVQPPDVPSSDFAVSVQGGASEKETYLHIDTSAIPAGSTVSTFVLTLNEDSTAPGDGLAAQAAVKAYAATAFFADGAAARPYGERPPYDAKGPSATGNRDSGAGGGQATGAKWSFDLTQIVNAWLSGTVQNNGVALVGDTGQSQNFEVVWAGPTTNPSVAPPPKAEGTVTPGASGGAPPVPVENAGSGSATPSSGSGASPAVTVPVSTSGPGIPAIDQPVAPPANHASPAVASAPAPAQRARRAGSHRAPPAGLWVAGLGAILLGLACMAVLGPGGEPGGRRRGSVLRALERRAAQAGAGPGMTDPVTGGAAS